MACTGARGLRVILRVVNGRIPPGGLASVGDAYRRTYAPAAETTDGLARYVVAARELREGHHVAAMTVWASVEAALAAYGGNLTALRTLDGADHGVRWSRVDYYEVHEIPGAADADAAPTLLRLTAGRVARGLDAEIQQELRRRVPELPPQATAAWVGRRVIGSDVEIAFASTWTEEPADVPLDAPLWPAVSDRYEVFRVEVHRILLEGTGRP